MAIPKIIKASDVRTAVELQEKIVANFRVEQFVTAGNNEIAKALKSFENSLLPPPSQVIVYGTENTTEATVKEAANYFDAAGYKTEVKHHEGDYHDTSYYYLVISFKG